MTTITLRRSSIVAIYEAVVDVHGMMNTPDWRPGPLPLRMSPEEVTDERWRSQFVHERVRDPLFDGARRRHRLWVDQATPKVPATGLEVVAAEILRFRFGKASRTNALLALHLGSTTEGRALVGEFKTATRELDAPRAKDVIAFLDDVLPGSSHVFARQRNATLLAFATHDHSTALEIESTWVRGRPETWSTVDAWRWAFAMASPPTQSELDSPHEPITPGRLVKMPRRDVQVVDRGVAIFGSRQDTRARASREYEKDEVRARTLFLDALLLGVVQRILVAQLADDAAKCGDPARKVRALRAVRRDVRIFRNRFWWREFSTWGWPDEILRAYQAEHGLVDQVDQLIKELNDYSTEASVATAQRTNLGLAMLALIGIPGGAATILSALSVEAAPAGEWLLWIGGLTLVAAIAILTSFVGSYRGRGPRDQVDA